MNAPAVLGRRPVLVTGGAGFIGANLADRLAREGHDVLVYDALLRPGWRATSPGSGSVTRGASRPPLRISATVRRWPPRWARRRRSSTSRRRSPSPPA
ncbi:FAD-dependent oxidoreductase [Siccirubricoccus deserti]